MTHEDSLVLTLIGPDGTRHEPSHQVTAAADEPHTLLPTYLQMVAAATPADSDYEVEVALGAGDHEGRVLYTLRCLDTEQS